MVFNYILGILAGANAFSLLHTLAVVPEQFINYPAVRSHIANRFIWFLGFFLVLAYRLWG